MRYEDIVQETLETLKQMGADQVEVILSETDDFEVAGSNSDLNLVRNMENATLRIRVIQDSKQASATLNDLSPASRDTACKNLMESVAVAEPDPAYDMSELSGVITQTIGMVPESAEAMAQSRERLTALTHEFSEGIAKAYPSIMLSEFGAVYKVANILLANTKGTRLYEKRGAVEIVALFNAANETKSSSFNYAYTCPRTLDQPVLSSPYWCETLARNEKELDTVTFDHRLERNVVLTPSCLAELVSYAEHLALSDMSFIRDFSKWKAQLGQKVCDEKLTWRCDPLSEEIGAGYGITGDGYPAENLTVIDKGILKSFLLSDYAAKKTGQTRSANQGGIYILEPGDTAFEDMIQSIDNGLLISRLSGGHPSPNGDFSGIAKNSFMIENGVITDAVSEAMATFNVFEVLADLAALSKERHDSGAFIAPYALSHKILVTPK